ncbi:MAG: hydrolase [Eubacteriales bacterium]|nr:hydrolase [Eubacteriales bacterium]
MKSKIPTYNGILRGHSLSVPEAVYKCTGINIFGKRIKSLVFSTDVAIIKNINTDAVLCVYPFTPQPLVAQALISVSDVPVFVGVGGGLTKGIRAVRLAEYAEHQGAFGVIVNAPIKPEIISEIKKRVELPVLATIVSIKQDIKERIEAGADILNIAASYNTPEVIKYVKSFNKKIPIIATGGPSDDTIMQTIEAGANAITYTPPSNAEIFAKSMQEYRERYYTN